MAKQQKSELLSVAGQIWEIWKAFVDEVKTQGGGDEDLRRILTDPQVRQGMVGLLLKKAKSSADGVIRLFVDYIRPLANMIKEDGRFDHVNSNITEKNFPITKRPNWEVEMKVFTTQDLVGETRSLTSEEVIQALKNKGYREAELPEGLAYAKANPDEQREYPILLLGSTSDWRDWCGHRYIPYLGRGGGGRD